MGIIYPWKEEKNLKKEIFEKSSKCFWEGVKGHCAQWPFRVNTPSLKKSSVKSLKCKQKEYISILHTKMDLKKS